MSTRKDHWLGQDAPRERRLAALLSRMDRYRRFQEATMRLGTAALRLLWLFADGRARTLKEIAAELSLEQSTVNRQVNAALDSGLLERMRRSGGNAYEFDRTTEGRRVFEEDTGRSLGAYATALEAMGDDDAERLLQLAERFVEHYRREVEPLGDPGPGGGLSPARPDDAGPP